MRWSVTLPLILLIISLIFSSCKSEKSEFPSRNWDPVIKEIQIVFTLEISDSLKQVKIKKIFENHQISIDEYRKFYDYYVKEEPLQNMRLLKGIEKEISEEMKQETLQQKKKVNDIDYNRNKPDSKK